MANGSASESIGCGIAIGLAAVAFFAAIVLSQYVEHLTTAEAMRNGYEQRQSGWGAPLWKKKGTGKGD